jgi:hypothetical protein
MPYINGKYEYTDYTKETALLVLQNTIDLYLCYSAI